ncbi:unnamed protein product, partial [Staurois parvus]
MWPTTLWLSCSCSQLLPLCYNTNTNNITVDRGIFSSKEISQMDLFHRWQPIKVPRLNSLSSLEQPILSQNVCRSSLHAQVLD